MPKSASTDLFDLVRSLTKAEKAYIRPRLIKGDEEITPVYIQLFDAVEKLKEYDEQILLKKIPALKAQRLSETKNYLYATLLNSLEQFHKEGSVTSRLAHSLSQIEILYSKGLFHQCQKLIQRSKLLAKKFEKHLHLLQLIHWECLIISSTRFLGSSQKQLIHIFKEEERSIGIYKNMSNYYSLTLQFYMDEIVRKSSPNRSDFKLLQKKTSDIIDKIKEPALSFSEKLDFYFCCNFYYSSKNDFLATYLNNKKFIRLFETNPHQIKEKIKTYIGVLNNMLISQFYLKKYDEVLPVIKKLRTLAVEFGHKSNELAAYINPKANVFELEYYMYTGKFSEGIIAAKKMETQLNNRHIKTDEKKALHFMIAIIYFGVGNYLAAKTWLNKVLKEKNVVRSDLYRYSKILSAIVYFELKEDALLEYTVKSIKHFLKKGDQLKVETLILNFLEKISLQKEYEQNWIPEFKKFKADLIKVTKDPIEYRVITYFDFISWAESVIENKPFAEIVKKRVKG